MERRTGAEPADGRLARHARTLAGRDPYLADLDLPGVAEVAFRRSDEAHGRLLDASTADVPSNPRLIGAWAAADLPGLPATPPTPPNPAPDGMERPSLATDRVRYVGEPVAVVAAADRYAAEDALEAIWPDIDPLPAVIDPVEAARPESARLFEGLDNVVVDGRLGDPIDDVWDSAPVRIEGRFRYPRVSHVSIEARGFAAAPAPGGGLDVWCSHQAPHRLRQGLADALGLEAERIRVRVPRVGGAFGGKSQLYPEYVTVAYLASLLDRPVRWVEDRRESFISASHGRGQHHLVRLAADRDGRILALDAVIHGDIGAYPHIGTLVPTISGLMMSGPYRIGRLHVRHRSVLTSAVPTAPYRGAGRPETTTSLEVMVDRLARELDLDPAEVRMRNFVEPDEFPYTTPTGESYDSGRYADALRSALEAIGYPDRGTPTDEGSLVGVGMSSFIERAGGQSNSSEYGGVEIRSDGSVLARSGSVSTGQDHATTFAEIVSGILDLDPSDVEVVEGDTGVVPSGVGTFASRSTQLGGSALRIAAGKVLEEARRRASAHLEAADHDLVYSRGRFHVAGAEQRAVSLGDLAEAEPLAADETFASDLTYPFGSYAARVEVDRETGAVSVVRLVAVDDCGNILDAAQVHGQAMGSITQGLSSVLHERIVFDDLGQPQTTSLLDYAVPTASEMPPIVLRNTVTPSPRNPLGAKGAGEAGCIGVPAAVLNAIEDALGGVAPPGEPEIPVSPGSLWERIEGREGAHR